MYRFSLRSLCGAATGTVAATTATPEATPETKPDAAPTVQAEEKAEEAAKKSEKKNPPQQQQQQEKKQQQPRLRRSLEWRPVTPPSWRCLPANAPPLHFLGDKLGPRPTVLLPSFEGKDKTLPEWREVMSIVNSRHGTLHLEYGASVEDVGKQVRSAAQERMKLRATVLDVENCSAERRRQAARELELMDDGFMSGYSQVLAEMLNGYDVEAAHLVCHSAGALVATKFATLFPEMVASIVVLDTPLVSRRMLNNEQRRSDVMSSVEDVNVPRDLVESALTTLEEWTEKERGPFCPVPQDMPLFSALFDRSSLFAKKGINPDVPSLAFRDSSLWISPDLLSNIRQPIMLMTPSDPKDAAAASNKDKKNKDKNKGGKQKDGKNATDGTTKADEKQGGATEAAPKLPAGKGPVLREAALHKELFNVRKHITVKTAFDHDQLLTTPSSREELSAGIAQWLDRYDLDWVMAKRWEALASEFEKSGGPVHEETESAKGKKGGDREKAKAEKEKRANVKEAA